MIKEQRETNILRRPKSSRSLDLRTIYVSLFSILCEHIHSEQFVKGRTLMACRGGGGGGGWGAGSPSHNALRMNYIINCRLSRDSYLSTAFMDLLRRRANARNVSFRISLRWLTYIVNSVDKTKLSNNTLPVEVMRFSLLL